MAGKGNALMIAGTCEPESLKRYGAYQERLLLTDKGQQHTYIQACFSWNCYTVCHMELWFWAAVAGAVLAGLSNFCFKIAASRGYNAEIFSLYGGSISLVIAATGLWFFVPTQLDSAILIIVTIIAGAIATTGGIMKVYALQHIDTTIFFPLFKLLSPLLAIIAGLMFFGERFTYGEWFGIVLGLTVPLLLITKLEGARQKNLLAGLVLVGLTAATSATAAALNKYVIEAGLTEWETLWYSSWGIFVGTLLIIVFKEVLFTTGRHIIAGTDRYLVFYGSLRASLICFSMLLVLYAYGNGGTLGIVQTIHSMYILIPIVLSIIFYHEHWNWQKVVAIILSIAALGFFH